MAPAVPVHPSSPEAAARDRRHFHGARRAIETPPEDTYKARVGGLKVGYTGHVPGMRWTLGTSTRGALTQQQGVGPPAPPTVRMERTDEQIRRAMFRPVREPIKPKALHSVALLPPTAS